MNKNGDVRIVETGDDGSPVYEADIPLPKEPTSEQKYIDSLKLLAKHADRLAEVGHNLEQVTTNILAIGHLRGEFIEAAGYKIVSGGGRHDVKKDGGGLGFDGVDNKDYSKVLDRVVNEAKKRVNGEFYKDDKGTPKKIPGIVDYIEILGSSAHPLILGKRQLKKEEREALNKIANNLKIVIAVFDVASRLNITENNRDLLIACVADKSYLIEHKDALVAGAELLLEYNARFRDFSPKKPGEIELFNQERSAMGVALKEESRKYALENSPSFAAREKDHPGQPKTLVGSAAYVGKCIGYVLTGGYYFRE